MFPFTENTINFAVFFLNQTLLKKISLTILRAAHAYCLFVR